MQICQLTVDAAFFFSLHISPVPLLLIRLLTVAWLQNPNYYVENTIFHGKRLLTLSRLAAKTGKSVKDMSAQKGTAVIFLATASAVHC